MPLPVSRMMQQLRHMCGACADASCCSWQPPPPPPAKKKAKSLTWLYAVIGVLVGLIALVGAPCLFHCT